MIWWNQCPPCISSIRIHWSTKKQQLVFDITSTKATAPFLDVHAWRKHVNASWEHIANNCLQINPVFSPRHAGGHFYLFILYKMSKRWVQPSFIATCVTLLLVMFSPCQTVRCIFQKFQFKKIQRGFSV